MQEKILLTHVEKYPLMQPRDAVKLLYQSSFGGGHLIQNEAACLEFLRREYAATPQTGGALLEEIGNGMVRVQLSALDAHGYSPEQLGRDFIRSAACVQGNKDRFLQTLSLLTELTRVGQMPFSPGELEVYLAGYAAEGYPMVSHSDIYREAYHPAYRVLCRDCLPKSLTGLLQNSKIVR